MIITTQEALRAVPQALREASFGVGATKWETIRHHVLPVAMPAILTGSVLTIARAFGEAAPLLLAGALVTNFFQVSAGAEFRRPDDGWSHIPPFPWSSSTGRASRNPISRRSPRRESWSCSSCFSSSTPLPSFSEIAMPDELTPEEPNR